MIMLLLNLAIMKDFILNLKFNDGLELAENWFYYDKEYALQEFKKYS